MRIVKNAVIMAAGTSSRFAPISIERPKALINVKGEILIERQIKQLKESGIYDISIVVGYKHEGFSYLKDKFNVKLIDNPYYNERNNNSTIKMAEDILSDTYICSADNYFTKNPFTKENECSYYASIYEDKKTNEWCIQSDENGYIKSVTIGGENSWIMMGHCFFDSDFSKKFLEILNREYDKEETKDKLWEQIFIEHIKELPKMKIKKYDKDFIFEFDSLDELREFDTSYKVDSHSLILKDIAKKLGFKEGDIVNIKSIKGDKNEAIGINFLCKDTLYEYYYDIKKVVKVRKGNIMIYEK